ncbi:hypothetical protein ANN_26287 [Periplaneta americana]|uniref:Uncharacterized protein n=1 Tax=Periplaneta americana TaxID=6978 RepID=A0ABQ8S5I0_PERAM|nr:hypothetical protein ANN_26287 [Periplaneta americana]
MARPGRPSVSDEQVQAVAMMKEPLHGIRFQTVPEILQAVDRSIRNINRTGAPTVIRLPHWSHSTSNRTKLYKF